jgi:hypothetical protein
MVLADINPKDGTWKSKMHSDKVIGCPSMVKSMISKQSMKSYSKKVDFSEPFHPRSIFGELGQAKWKKVAPNKWKGVMKQGGGTQTGMNMKWSIEVVSTTEMKMSANVNMMFSPEMAAKLGGSGECKTESSGTFIYIGN